MANLLVNDLMTIDLSPENGILEVIYGDLYLLPMEVIKDQIVKTMALINKHEVKKVLYDSSKTKSAASTEESKEIADFLFAKLSQTTVERVARLRSPNFITDARVQANLKANEKEMNTSFAYESFTDRQEAIEWLLGWESRQMT